MEFFVSCADSDCVGSFSNVSANQIGVYHPQLRMPREILIKFLSWRAKSKVLELFWEMGSEVEGIRVSLI